MTDIEIVEFSVGVGRLKRKESRGFTLQGPMNLSITNKAIG